MIRMTYTIQQAHYKCSNKEVSLRLKQRVIETPEIAVNNINL